jgi:hypothetical protein
MKKHLLFLTIALLTFKTGNSQTNVSGGIFTNTTWNLAGSPYIAIDNIVVMGGVTLTISPGVTVKFNDTKGMEVRGNLQATGTITDTIVFTSASPSPTKGIWSNISFWNNLSMDYVKISYATTALVNTNFNILNISNSRFSTNIMGIDFIGASSSNVGYVFHSIFDNNNTAISTINHANYISNSSFINNGIGIGYVYNVLISNNSFIGHTTKAIDGYDANYIGNTFTNNNIGLRIKLFISNNEIKNNIITNNQIGVQARGDATSTPNSGFHNNTICNNSTYNFENTDNVSLYIKNNCWCTTDSVAIANSIHDAYDNLALGIAFYSPFITGCAVSGIEDYSETQSVAIYPNPFSEYATFKFDNIKNEKHTLTVFNSLGQIQLSFSNILTDKIKIERANLTEGLYFFQLRTDTKVMATGKFIIK